MTVMKQLGQQDHINELYVMGIQGETDTDAMNDLTCDAIIEAYQRRTMKLIMQSMISKADNKDDNPANIINKTITALENLSSEENKREFVSLQDMLFPALENIHKRNDSKMIIGIPTGLPKLDKYTNGWQSGDTYIIGAPKKAGKSILGIKFAMEAACKGFPVGIFSFEMSAMAITERFVASMAKVDVQAVHWKKLTDKNNTDLSNACDTLYKYNQIIFDDNSASNIDNLLIKAKRMKSLYGVKLIIVDYLQLMPSMGNEGRQREIEKISHELKGLAKRLNIPIIIISQLSRPAKGREDAAPKMTDLRDSGMLEADATVVMLVYNPSQERKEELVKVPNFIEWDNVRELIIDANRNGPTGGIPIYFKGEFSHMGELE